MTTDSTPSDLSPRQVAIHAARAGGTVLQRYIGTALDIRYKGEIDVVTQADEQAEAAIVATIRAAFPDHQILAEEGSTGGADPEHRWIVDPLDGTTNFSHGLAPFSVSIAYERNGRIEVGVVYDPTREELFLAERGRGATLNERPLRVSSGTILRRALVATGFPYDPELMPVALGQFATFATRAQAVRRIGSAALDMAYVAAGRFEAYWEASIKAWDVAAGVLIVEEAGGRVTALDGSPLDLRAPHLTILASNDLLHEAMLESLAQARPILS